MEGGAARGAEGRCLLSHFPRSGGDTAGQPEAGPPLLQSPMWWAEACWIWDPDRSVEPLTCNTNLSTTLLQGNGKMPTFNYTERNSDLRLVWILYLNKLRMCHWRKTEESWWATVNSTSKVWHYHSCFKLTCNSLRVPEMGFYNKINKF